MISIKFLKEKLMIVIYKNKVIKLIQRYYQIKINKIIILFQIKINKYKI